MRDGRCSRCGAATVRAARNGVELGGDTPQAMLRPHRDAGARGMFRLHPAEVWNFACLTCGALEWAIYDPAAIEFIRQQWMEVTPQPAPPPPPA